MELEDGAFSRLASIKIGSDPQELFEGCDFIFLVGAKPRGQGMERIDLLKDNARIFLEQGLALQAVANEKVRLLVVGNPCNTNAWILSQFATKIPKSHIHAMTRLDQNRASAALAKKAKISVSEVRNMIIWGNHSSTQVPDFNQVTLDKKSVLEKLDRAWLEGEFISSVQARGSAVLARRGKSSAASAANAAIHAAYDIVHPSEGGYFYSSAVYSGHNRYGLDRDLYYSFPCRTTPSLEVEVVTFDIAPSVLEKMKKTEKELIEERDQLRLILPVLKGEIHE